MQKIGFWSLSSLVIGNLLGSAVFLLPSTLAQYGSVSMVAWCITALGAIMLALVFAELSNKIPKNGGPYAFVSHAFGRNMGFIIAWGYWILSWISNAALLAGIAGYLALISGPLEKETVLVIEIFILLLITCFNLLGIKAAGRGEIVFTILKIIPLIMIPIFGIFAIDIANFPPFTLENHSLYDTLNATAFITLWGFLGLETGTVPGSGVINAKKNIPLATVFGTLVAAIIYILGTVVTFGVIPNDVLVKSTAPYAETASFLFGGAWGVPIAIMAVITCIGSLNGWTIVVGRIAQSAADDGLFPASFKKVNKNGTPYYSIVTSAVLTLPFIIFSATTDLIAQFNMIIDISVTFILFVYMACVLSFFKILHQSGNWSIYKATIFLLSFVFVLWAFFATKPQMLLYSLLISLSGLPVWIYVRYSHKANYKSFGA